MRKKSSYIYNDIYALTAEESIDLSGNIFNATLTVYESNSKIT